MAYCERKNISKQQYVGLGIKPKPVYVNDGGVIELGMEGLGSNKQVAKTYK